MTCRCFYSLEGMDKDARRKMIIYIELMAKIADNASYQRIYRMGRHCNRAVLHDCGVVSDIVDRFTSPDAHVLPDCGDPPEHIIDICINLLVEASAFKAKRDKDAEDNPQITGPPPPSNTTEAQVAKLVYRRLPLPPPTVWWQKLLIERKDARK